MWTLLREISLRHLRHSPLRSGLVVLGISLGVCMLTAVLATNDSLVSAFEDMVDRVAGKADLTVAGSDSGIPSSLTGEIAEVEGVEHAAAMLEVVTRSADGKGGSLLVLGVDFLGDTFFLPFAQEGEHQVVEDPLAFVNDPTAILVSRKLALSRGLKVGDSLPLATSNGVTTFYVRGLLEDNGPAASFGGQVIVMFIDAAQVTFSRGYSVDRIDIVVAKDASADEVQQRIQKVIEGRATVEAPKGRTRRLVGSLWAFKNGLNMSGAIALCVGMFLIYNAVSISVAQRRREVGTLRALGVTQKSVVWLFCLEALIMASVGTVIGLILAQQLASVALSSVGNTVNRFLMPIHPPEPHLSARVMLAGVASGFLTTLIASYLPARVTTQVDPAEALRASRSTSMTGAIKHKKLAILGLIVSALAYVPIRAGGELNGYLASGIIVMGAILLVPLWVKLLRLALVGITEAAFGIPGRLALDNVERSLGRSATTVVALMLAVAMSMSVGAYAASFEKSILQWTDDAFPSDAMVTAGSPLLDRHHVAFSPAVLEKLAGTPGVKSINPVRTATTDVGGRRVQIASVDTRVAFTEAKLRGKRRPVLAGPSEFATDALYEKPRILIAENTARHEQLSVGDTFEFATPTGKHKFEVYAVVIDYSSDQGWFMMDRRWFNEYWQDELIDGLDLYFTPGADHDNVVNVVRGRLGGVHGLFVTLHDGLRDEMRSASKAIFSYAKAPELITLVVAIMGVIGTMLAAVIDRIREIGMLRAIGATRRQVAMSVVAEAGFLGLSAALYGVVAGVPLGYTLLKVVGTATSGWNLPYGFPMETALRMSGLVVLAAALSGYFPGQRAAGMDVKDALAYE